VQCLEAGCGAVHKLHEGNDLCSICYIESLNEAPCLELGCGHVFHTHCLEEKLTKRWPTARISFNFMDCPLCKEQIAHTMLQAPIAQLNRFRDNLEARYTERLKLEGLLADPAIEDAGGAFHGDPLAFSRKHLTYFQCFKCQKPYFGGLAACQGADHEDPNREELVCGGCSAGSTPCPKHGQQYMEYKCKYCCNVAVWYCWGTTHFCDMCHSPPRKSVRVECPGEELCTLKLKHLPNGQEFAIGCALCRSNAKEGK
jgi:E3 ubiquitin-protein ligase MYCBP2